MRFELDKWDPRRSSCHCDLEPGGSGGSALHQKTIVAVNGPEEIETVHAKYVHNVPSARTTASVLNLSALLSD